MTRVESTPSADADRARDALEALQEYKTYHERSNRPPTYRQSRQGKHPMTETIEELLRQCGLTSTTDIESRLEDLTDTTREAARQRDAVLARLRMVEEHRSQPDSPRVGGRRGEDPVADAVETLRDVLAGQRTDTAAFGMARRTSRRGYTVGRAAADTPDTVVTDALDALGGTYNHATRVLKGALETPGRDSSPRRAVRDARSDAATLDECLGALTALQESGVDEETQAALAELRRLLVAGSEEGSV